MLYATNRNIAKKGNVALRVLVVESNHAIREGLVYIFEKNGYFVDEAEDGGVGLRMALSNKYQIVVTNLGIPELCGLALIKKIRDKKLDYPILIHTTRMRWEDKVGGLEAGADDYLCMPCSLEKLFSRAKRLMLRPNRLMAHDTSDMAAAHA